MGLIQGLQWGTDRAHQAVEGELLFDLEVGQGVKNQTGVWGSGFDLHGSTDQLLLGNETYYTHRPCK